MYLHIEGVQKMESAFKKLIKEKWKAVEMHCLLYPTWETSKFPVSQKKHR